MTRALEHLSKSSPAPNRHFLVVMAASCELIGDKTRLITDLALNDEPEVRHAI